MGDSLFGLDLPPSSAFRYSRYSQLLAARKLLPNEVVTRFTTAEATNKRDKTKKYAVVNFETIAPLGDDPPVDSDDDEGDGNGSSGDDDIPFCCDGGCDAKHE